MKPGNLSVKRKRCQFLRDETCVIPSETRAFLFPDHISTATV
jgi:hypothetical protein